MTETGKMARWVRFCLTSMKIRVQSPRNPFKCPGGVVVCLRRGNRDPQRKLVNKTRNTGELRV